MLYLHRMHLMCIQYTCIWVSYTYTYIQTNFDKLSAGCSKFSSTFARLRILFKWSPIFTWHSFRRMLNSALFSLRSYIAVLSLVHFHAHLQFELNFDVDYVLQRTSRPTIRILCKNRNFESLPSTSYLLMEATSLN